jgi:hypothetical protein
VHTAPGLAGVSQLVQLPIEPLVIEVVKFASVLAPHQSAVVVAPASPTHRQPRPAAGPNEAVPETLKFSGVFGDAIRPFLHRNSRLWKRDTLSIHFPSTLGQMVEACWRDRRRPVSSDGSVPTSNCVPAIP